MYRKKILFLIVMMGLAFGLYFVFIFNKTFFWDNTAFEEESVAVYIYEGDDFNKVMSVLTPLLKSPNDFVSAAQKKGYDIRVKSGKFIIRKKSNNNEIINTLRGKSLTVRVTFNNQERIEDGSKGGNHTLTNRFACFRRTMGHHLGANAGFIGKNTAANADQHNTNKTAANCRWLECLGKNERNNSGNLGPMTHNDPQGHTQIDQHHERKSGNCHSGNAGQPTKNERPNQQR